jgi:hypothetical protein
VTKTRYTHHKEAETKYVENLKKFCSDFTIIGSYSIIDQSRVHDYSKIIDSAYTDSESKLYVVYDSTKSSIGYSGFSAYLYKSEDLKKGTEKAFEKLFTPTSVEIKIGVLMQQMMRSQMNCINGAACRQKKDSAIIECLANYDKISNQIKEKQMKLMGHNSTEQEYKSIVPPNISEITTPLKAMNFLQKLLMYQQ